MAHVAHVLHGDSASHRHRAASAVPAAWDTARHTACYSNRRYGRPRLCCLRWSYIAATSSAVSSIVCRQNTGLSQI